MITTLIAGALGAVVARVLWNATRERFELVAFQRRNYRDAPVVTAVGVLLPIVLVVVGAVGVMAWALVQGFDAVERWTDLARAMSSLPAVVIVASGFCLLGLLDDLAGVGQSGGFRGHLTAMRHGQLTTGGMKLLGGPMVALIGVASLRLPDHLLDVLRDGAVVALAANAVNLLDRAPGRANKVGLVVFVAVASSAGVAADLAPMAAVFGASLVLLWPDLREQMMLGDAGSNVIGAVAGLTVVASVGDDARWVAVGVLLALNAASERWSFSEIIDSVRPLRAIDRWGSPYR